MVRLEEVLLEEAVLAVRLDDGQTTVGELNDSHSDAQWDSPILQGGTFESAPLNYGRER